MFWRPGWVEAPREEFRDAVARVAAMPNWIMDGNYTFTFDLRLPLADTVIWLDLPRHICMWRVITRTARGYGRTRAGLAEDCPERFDWEFLNYVWKLPYCSPSEDPRRRLRNMPTMPACIGSNRRKW